MPALITLGNLAFKEIRNSETPLSKNFLLIYINAPYDKDADALLELKKEKNLFYNSIILKTLL